MNSRSASWFKTQAFRFRKADRNTPPAAPSRLERVLLHSAGWLALVAEVLAGVATLPLVLLLAAAPLLWMGTGDAGTAGEAGKP